MSDLIIKNVDKYFDKKAALKNIDIEIEAGEFVCILGPSGCGKSTLLRIIAGLETADRGQIIMDGRDCTMLPPSKRNFGIVFQSYALFPNMTVEQNIYFGLIGQKHINKKEKKAKVTEVLKLVDLMEHKNKYPNQLSGGQQQRTALARAIALSPQYLLLDEPLSALDAKVRTMLRGQIRKIQRELGITTIMVTHDQEEALTMADRIIVMNNAIVEQVGTPREIYEEPASAFVASFIGTMNFYEDSNGLFGIRPEHIELVREEQKDSSRWSGTIIAMEFRGALTRIYSKLSTNREICIDVPSYQGMISDLKENDTVYFKINNRNAIRNYSVQEAG